MGFLGNIFGGQKNKGPKTIFSAEEIAEMEVRNKELAEEQQVKIGLKSEFQKFSSGIDDYFYEKSAGELDEEILNNFTVFCVEKLNAFPDLATKKAIWGLIREYVMEMYSKEKGDDVVLFLDSVELQVL